jgi:hypothetical protein
MMTEVTGVGAALRAMMSNPGARAERGFFCPVVIVCYFFLPIASFAAEAPPQDKHSFNFNR